MKKSLTIILGLALASNMALAERPDGARGKGNPEQRMQRMQKHLDLSDAQVSQIRDIRANGGGREEIRGVLTEDQQARIREHRQQRKDRHKEDHRQLESSSEAP
jgi:Spy/CpxP family protein refolding chaperone